MGENLNPSCKNQTSSFESIELRVNPVNWVNRPVNWAILDYCWWSRCKFLSVTFTEVICGQSRSPAGLCQYLTIEKKLQTWTWCYCAFLVETHRLICNMTYFGQHVTLTWGQILTLILQGHHCFDVPCRKEHDGARIMPLAFLVQMLFAKKCFCQKQLFLPFLTPAA